MSTLAAIPYLRAGLAPLNEAGKGLLDRTLSYIADGAGSEVLDQLRLLPHSAAQQVGFPSMGITQAGQDKLDDARMRSRKQAMNAAGWCAQQMHRFALVLDALDRGVSLPDECPGLPDWWHYLAWEIDAAVSWPSADPLIPSIDGRFLLQIMEYGGLAPEQRILAVFEPTWSRMGRNNVLDIVDRQPDLLHRCLLDWRGAFPAALPLASTPARLNMLGKLATLAAPGPVPATIPDSGSDPAPFAEVLGLLSLDSEATVEAKARRLLPALSDAARAALRGSMLESAVPATRQRAAVLAASDVNPGSVQVLATAFARESDPQVRAVIAMAQAALGVALEMPVLPSMAAPACTLPAPTALGGDALAILCQARRDVLARREQEARRARELHGGVDKWERWAVVEQAKLTDAGMVEVLDIINGLGVRPRLLPTERAVVASAVALWQLPDFTLLHAARIHAQGEVRPDGDLYSIWTHPQFPGFYRALEPEQADLRALGAAFASAGLALETLIPECEPGARASHLLASFPAERAWPFFTAHPELVATGLLLRPGKMATLATHARLWTALQAAASLPVPVAAWLAPLYELAIYGKREFRAPARKLLAPLPGLAASLVTLLDAEGVDLPDTLLEWVGELGDRVAEPALRHLLGRDTATARRARILAALGKVGADMSAFFGPDALLHEAQQGLREAVPANLSWFPFDALPPCRWLDGSAVAPEIIAWWIRLAHQLKDVAGSAILDRYLELLTPVSASTLGSFILVQFIKFDTRPPSDKSVLTYATTKLANELPHHVRHATLNKLPFTAEDEAKLLEKFKREKLRECVGSAIGAKGVLAVAHHAPGHEIASRARAFMRDYHTRLAQIEALLELLAHRGDAASMQFLMALAHSYRKAPIQRRAGELVQAIATRKGWTEQQLADRSVPYAGFDERGVLDLGYGTRKLQVRLNDKLAPLLYSDDGALLKTLPAARKDDDAEEVKAAKLQLAACKKELKQVIDRQGRRLHEAMCIRRSWTAQEWRGDILGHPLLGRLAQQLIWEALDERGAVSATFRPASDKSLATALDDDMTLADGDQVRLAHGVLLDAEAIAAWQAHFADYKLLPLFAQLSHRLPPPADPASPLEIADHDGAMADVYRLSGAFEKRGYLRGSVGDGGMICEFTKAFPAIGIQAEIGFSGASVHGGNEPAALTSLRFKQLSVAGQPSAELRIDAVPPVLLAEAYADYVAVAAVCNRAA